MCTVQVRRVRHREGSGEDPGRRTPEDARGTSRRRQVVSLESQFDRLFTVEEANALIPKLRELLAEVLIHRDALRERSPQMEPVISASMLNGGGKRASQFGVEAYRMYLAIEAIRSIGIVPKDLDTGLMDFPHERDGRIVFLCWHPPEDEISHYHELSEGFAGRKPI